MLLFDFRENKVISSKAAFFVIGEVCASQFVGLNIGFCVISFVGNWYDVNFSTLN